MTITLPSELDSFLQGEVAAGRYGSVSEAVCEAVDRMRREHAAAELGRKLDAGIQDLDAGRFTEVATKEDAAALRSRLLQNVGKRAAAAERRD